MDYSISIDDLLNRDDIRSDFSGNESWMNKLTDAEIEQFYLEAREMCINESVKEKFPDINAALLAKVIDRGILYKLFKMNEDERN